MIKLLTSKQVSELLSISLATVSRMVRSNRLPFILIGSGKKKKTVRFVETQLNAWCARRSRGAVPPKRNPAVTATAARSEVIEKPIAAPVQQASASMRRANHG